VALVGVRHGPEAALLQHLTASAIH
jgi:hypothetical protein